MTPAMAKAVVNPVCWDAQLAGPLSHDECFATKGQTDILPCVALLYFVCGPAAVALAIARIVVNAINAVTFWAITHVRIKGIKRLPCEVIVNAASSVQLVVLMGWLVAALFHGAPRVVRQRAREAMCRVSLCRGFASQTAARFGMPALEFPGFGRCVTAAITCAVPLASTLIGNRSQAGKLLPRNADEAAAGIPLRKSDAKTLTVASTRSDGPTFYIPRSYGFFNTALAFEEPEGRSVNRRHPADCSQKPVNVPSQINVVCHAGLNGSNKEKFRMIGEKNG